MSDSHFCYVHSVHVCVCVCVFILSVNFVCMCVCLCVCVTPSLSSPSPFFLSLLGVYLNISKGVHLKRKKVHLWPNAYLQKLEKVCIWTSPLQRWKSRSEGTRISNAQMTHIHVQNLKKKIMSLEYTPVTQSILCLIFLMCVLTTHNFNYSAQESKKQFAVYAVKYVTLKKGQGHQPWYELLYPKQCYNHAKCKRPP